MPRGIKTMRPVIDPLAPLPGIRMLFSDWMTKKHLAKDFTAKEKEANKALSEIVAEHGFADDKGHLWLDLGMEVEGYDAKGAPSKYNAIQRQRRVSLIVNEAEAIDLLGSRGLLGEASTSYVQITDPEAAIAALANAGLLDGSYGVEISTEIEESKISALYFQGKITKEEYDLIVTPKVTWALYPSTLS